MKNALLDKLTHHPARMEVLLAELIETKMLSESALVVRPRSLFKRSYSKDILSYEVTTQEGKKKQTDTIAIDVAREGLYDALPEFLFHAPEAMSGYKNLEQRVHESEKAKEEEAEARRFFLPLEQEFFRQRIHLELEERNLLSHFTSPMQRALFDRFWTDVQGLDPAQEAMLFHLLPASHIIAGNHPLMAACFSAVLQERVSLNPAPAAAAIPSEDDGPALGEATLGLDFVAGEMADDDLPDLAVHIGPLDLDDLPDYLEGGKKNNLLGVLYNYFVPAEMDVNTQLILKEQESAFVLSDDEGTARLAFSTYI